MNILFMGTPDFARKSLQKLIDSKDFNIKAVVTNPDKPQGRGKQMMSSPVKILALDNDLMVLQPETLKNNDEFINQLRSMDLDVIVVVAYGKLLPKEILSIPKKGCVNVHASLLPKYRGAAPIQWALIKGEKETGVTTMLMNEGMDEGDILLTQKIDIEESDTSGSLFEKLGIIGSELLLETLNRMKNNDIVAKSQEGEPSYAPMIEKDLAKIDWEMQACEIDNLVRGLNPFLCCYTVIKDKRYKIWRSKEIISTEIEDLKEEYEQKFISDDIFIINNRLFAKTSENFLEILEIQGEGKKRLETAEFLRGKEF